MTAHFDTRRLVEQLEASGLSTEQAEVILEAMSEMRAEIVKWVAGIFVVQSAILGALVVCQLSDLCR